MNRKTLWHSSNRPDSTCMYARKYIYYLLKLLEDQNQVRSKPISVTLKDILKS